jgi:hypothetical protein
MAYEILSIGDAEMLYSAFQGAAMIFGNNNLNKLINAGFILGFLLISFRYLTNQEFPLRHGLIGIVVYSTMFTPKEAVIIEDVYTGEVRTVDSVPLGLAVPMSVISTMGVKMTDMFETAFSTPSEASLLQNGYLDSLNTLIKLRNIGTGTFGSSSLIDGDVGKSINAYVEHCVMFDLDIASGTHEVTKELLEKSTDLWEAMKTSFINIDVMLTLPSAPNGEQKNCKDAYAAISNYLSNDDFIDAMDRHVAGMLGIKDPSVKAVDRIASASTALGDRLGDSQTFMRNALMASYLKEGDKAFIHRQGKEQLNLQWAGEQSMFNEIAKPLMAFVEMFTVATSPIVAFLCTLGPIGLTMIIRYVQMMLWIALWGPVMSICNLYISIVTTRALEIAADNAESNGSGLAAMVMHDQLYGSLETWLSAGGMLAASVPALSLMLVYGGSVAATNLAGKMTSGASSSVNPDNLQKPMDVAAWGSMGSMTEMSPNVGAKLSGMADTNFSASSTYSRASQSAKDSLRSASSSAGETLTKINQLSNRSGSMSSHATAVTSAMNRTISDGSSWSTADGRTQSSSQKMTEQESEAVQAGVNGAFNGNLGSKMIGTSVQASLMSSSGISAARAQELGDLAQHVVNSGVMGSDISTSSSGSSTTSSTQEFQSSEEMDSLGKQYQSQLQAVKQASEKYTQTSSLQDSAGKSLNLPYQDLARRLNQSGAIVDINSANSQLKSNMSEGEYSHLSQDAQYEINRSSASGIVGGDRDALAGFLMLNKQDPLKAAEILNKSLTPTNNESGVKMGSDRFEGDAQSVDDLVNNQMAAGFRSKAKGVDDDADAIDSNLGNRGTGNGQRGSNANNLSAHREQMGKQHSTENAQQHKGQNQQINQKPTLGSSANSTKANVNAELGGYKLKDKFDTFKGRFKEGGHLDPNKINGTDMVLKAGNNFGDATHDVARDATVAVNEKADAIQRDLGNAAKQSIDSIKSDLGITKKPRSSNDIPNIPSDNDLPPIAK